jgi:hypothetical protein
MSVIGGKYRSATMLAGRWLIVGNGSAVRTKQRRTAKKPQAIIVIGTLTALVEEIFCWRRYAGTAASANGR